MARRLDPTQPDRFMLYHALCRAASAAAQTNDLAATRALLDEAQRIEDRAWPAQRLLWGVEAAQWFARMSPDTAVALQLGRRMLALDRERGSHAAIATGNLMDAELAAGDSAAAASSGFELVEALLGTRHEFSLAFARINLLAALLAQDDVAQARPVAQAAWAKAAVFDLCARSKAGRARPAGSRPTRRRSTPRATRPVNRNETTATTRAQALARQALNDDASFKRLRTEGAALRDAEVAALAFGIDDV